MTLPPSKRSRLTLRWGVSFRGTAHTQRIDMSPATVSNSVARYERALEGFRERGRWASAYDKPPRALNRGATRVNAQSMSTN